MTSGLDAIFPKGVRIGTVTEVSLDENQLQKNAVVDPSVDFNHIEEVLVLLTGPEKSGRTQEGED